MTDYSSSSTDNGSLTSSTDSSDDDDQRYGHPYSRSRYRTNSDRSSRSSSSDDEPAARAAKPGVKYRPTSRSCSPPGKAGHGTNHNQIHIGQIRVQVIKGSFLEQNADVIVNSCDRSLDLSRGRSSRALLEAAGRSIQRECSKKYPNGIQSGDIAVTGSGKLNCATVFHCTLRSYSGTREENVLEGIVEECLKKADKMQLTSIAFPPLGTGFLGYPAGTVAELMLQAISNLSTRLNTLDSVYFSIFEKDSSTYQTFVDTAKSFGRQRRIETKTTTSKGKAKAKQHTNPSPPHGPAAITKSYNVGKIVVEVLMGNLSKMKADVLIFNTEKDLMLLDDDVAAEISKATGSGLQKELNANYPTGLYYGDIAVASNHGLSCKQIYIGALPSWRDKYSRPEKALNNFVERCLQEGNEYCMKTLALTSLGIGSFKYPNDKIAQSMIGNIETFSKKVYGLKIAKVSVVIPKDYRDKSNVMAAFDRELSKIGKGVNAQVASTSTLSIASRKSGSIQFGNITVNVIVGQIEKEQVDIIVNTASPSLQLGSNSGLAYALLQRGGSQIQHELDKNYPKGISPGEIATTNGGALKCKVVYHGTMPYWYSKKKLNMKPEEIVQKFVQDCLVLARKGGHRSIAFPALGTGYPKFPPEVSAQCLFKAVKKFSATDQQITEIRIVLYGGGHDLHAIETAFKNECIGGKAQTVSQPKRGTPAFNKWICTQSIRPPTHWSHYTSSRTVKDWYINATAKPFQLTDPDPVIRQSIDVAFNITMNGPLQVSIPMLIPQPTVVSIKRIENIELFHKYTEECQRMFRKASCTGGMKSFSKIPGSSGEVFVMKYIDQKLKSQLYPEINEYYVFHGTNPAVVNAIQRQGLDCRVANQGRLGMGIYGAEKASKSLQYVSADKNGLKYMFLLRMCLGDVHITNTGGAFRRPPCKTCSSPVCTTHTELFDSVVADSFPNFIDREFVVYDKSQCYPEFLITFK